MNGVSLIIVIWFGHFLIIVKSKLINSHHSYLHATDENSDYNTRNCNSPNVRTTLFKNTHVSNLCWNIEDIGLLLARGIMQDILPRKMPQNMPLLLDYFKDCLITIKKEVRNRHVRIIMTTAMIDTLGGYLQAFGLSIVKRIYYEGNIDFETVNEFHVLQNNFKTILSTDGGSWPRPIVIRRQLTAVIPLKIPISTDKYTCQDVITIYDYCSNVTNRNNNSVLDNLLIPMPILDDYKNPHAIGIPVRCQNLFSLDNKCAYDVLLNYYTMSIQCLYSISKKTGIANDTDKNITYFDYVFFNWMIKNVLPRLTDEKWYPGFSSVYRILATIKQKGIPINNDKKFEILRLAKQMKLNLSETENFNRTINNRNYRVYVGILCLLFILFSASLLIACIKKKIVKTKQRDVSSDFELSENILLTGKIYYKTSSASSSNYISTTSSSEIETDSSMFSE